jgi:hypothetical protein
VSGAAHYFYDFSFTHHRHRGAFPAIYRDGYRIRKSGLPVGFTYSGNIDRRRRNNRGVLHGISRRGLILVLLLLASAVSTLPAHAAAAPAVSGFEVQAYRNVDSTGDLFFLLRYELPLSGWCAELTDTDGCSSTPKAPTDPFSLPAGAAQVTTYNGSPLTQQTASQAPRIDHGLGGAYFSAGHGITWADATMVVCIESSDTLYTPATSDCITPTWVGGDSVAETLPLLGGGVITMLRNIESALLEPAGTLVSGSARVTAAGRAYVIDAQPGLDRIIPDFMQAAAVSQGVTLSFTPTPGDTPLQTALNSSASSRGITADLEGVAQGYFGMDGTELAAITFLLFGAIAGLWAVTATGQPLYGVLIMFTTILAGVYVDGPSVSALLAVLAVPVVFGSFYVIKRVSD